VSDGIAVRVIGWAIFDTALYRGLTLINTLRTGDADLRF